MLTSTCSARAGCTARFQRIQKWRRDWSARVVQPPLQAPCSPCSRHRAKSVAWFTIDWSANASSNRTGARSRRQAGANRQSYARVAQPPFNHPCQMVPTKRQHFSLRLCLRLRLHLRLQLQHIQRRFPSRCAMNLLPLIVRFRQRSQRSPPLASLRPNPSGRSTQRKKSRRTRCARFWKRFAR